MRIELIALSGAVLAVIGVTTVLTGVFLLRELHALGALKD